jgi:class 3 adenylate cyclase/dienelactone hydrolase
MSRTRELAAIMFADIVGYTAMMEDDEGLAMKLREKLKSKLESEVILHGGRIIKFSGDGALCSFTSAAESVRAAMELQTYMQEDPSVPLRIGIHQADVVFEESDVHGDGVNIASRLESFAVPGSIFISAKVRDDIKNQKDIQTVSLGKYVLKNVKEPVEIYAVSNAGLSVPHKIKLDGKGIKFTDYKSSRRLGIKIVKLLGILTLFGVAGFFFIRPWIQKQYARHELLPQIQKLINENSRPPTSAYDLGLEAEKYVPNDSALAKLWPVIATSISMETEPEGAEVLWKDYNKPDTVWRSAGFTPLKNTRFPRSYLRMEIRKRGYQTIEYAGPWPYGRIGPDIAHLKLDTLGSLPENMVRIPKKLTHMYVVGLEKYGPKQVGEFLIDKYEVTNIQYKAFMDAGGYSNKAFWTYPIYSEGKEIPLSAALKLMLDRTGRQGPANWEAGTYPDGQEHYPVTGVSWYEAEAYAAFAHKKLPTIYHWSVVAETSRTEFIVPLSNYTGKGPTAVGSLSGYSTFGIYDLAGNAREWCFNENNDPGIRFILGGGWNDPTYAFNDGYTQSGLDRSVANGFRCIKEFPDDTLKAGLTASVTMSFRDYRKEKPVDDKTFQIFLRQYDYDKTALNAKIDTTLQSDFWTTEKISIDAAYNNNERMNVYVYLPKNARKPFQTIVFYPGSNDIYAKNFDPVKAIIGIDFILKSGRALVYPVYKGTCERQDGLKTDLQEATVSYKDHVIMWRKDIGRTLDYLETRSDIQSDKFGYLGWSWGGFMGGIIPAVEKRFKAIVLNVGGMEMEKALPEADQINFLPRITQPILMLNGKHDMFFPVETSQKPMFDFIATPKENKKRIVYESGHLVPRTDFVKETLIWYDKYLGTVDNTHHE